MSAFIRFLAGSASSAAAPVTATTTVRAIAKDRLSVILAAQRGSDLLEGVNLEQLQRDVLLVVQKHLDIAQNRPVNFSLNADGDVRLFEMSIELGVQEQIDHRPLHKMTNKASASSSSV